MAGGWYHVTARGNERRAIYRDDADRARFLETVGKAVEQFGMVVHAYVLMPNHYHLLVETPRANLSGAMQWINVSYSVWFNRRHRRAGHLFQGRFKAIAVEPGAYAGQLSRYVHLNPVRVKRLGLGKVRNAEAMDRRPGNAEMVARRVAALREYRWSSYRAYVGLERGPGWLTTEPVLATSSAGDEAGRRRAYREYVEEAVREGLAESPWEKLEGRVVLGGREFVERVRGALKGNAKEQPGLRQLRRVCGIGKVIEFVERTKGEKWEAFRDRHGDWGRDAVLYLGRKLCGMKLRELAELAGGVDDATAGMGVLRFEQRIKESVEMAALAERARAELLDVGM
jgi:REP element-mobilizing transposase RayT